MADTVAAGAGTLPLATTGAELHHRQLVTPAAGGAALLCCLPDANDGKPHVMHGMMKQVTVM
jgi:hypothetical protein